MLYVYVQYIYLNTPLDKDVCIHIEYNVDYNCDSLKRQLVNFEFQNIFNRSSARKSFVQSIFANCEWASKVFRCLSNCLELSTLLQTRSRQF